MLEPTDQAGGHVPWVPSPPPPAPPRGAVEPSPTGGWPSPAQAGPRPGRRAERGRWIVLVAAIVVLAAAGGAAGFLLVRHQGPTYPRAWDPRVAPLAAEAAKLRHLGFKHPVEVEFLSAAAYTKKSTDQSDPSAKERQDMADTVAEGRALGLLQGVPDLHSDANALNDSGTAAFYSYDDKKIYVRGTAMTVDLEATLVHELTHVLQDQNFDLNATYKRIDDEPGSDDSGFTALVEGDAVTVENAYVATLSEADQKAYDDQENAAGGTADKQLAQVPQVFQDLFDAPYEFGPTFVAILKVKGGEKAVDAAFRDPPTTFLTVWNPVLYLQHAAPAPVPDLPLPSGAKKIDDSPMGVVGGFLVLAERIPPLQALDAADAWRSDGQLSYRQNGRVCVDTRIRGVDAAGDDLIGAAFEAWAKAMPAGTATVTRTPDDHDVLVHSCDPGPKAALHVTDQGDSAIDYPGVRAAVAESAFDPTSGGDGTFNVSSAFCVANDAVHELPLSALTSDKDLPAEQEAKLESDAMACLKANRGNP